MLKFWIYKLIVSGPRKIRKYFYIYWHRLLFWAAGISFGKNMRVYNKFYLQIARTSDVSVGDDFTLISGDNFNPLSRNLGGGIFAAPYAIVRIGDKVGISSSVIRAKQSITIRNNVKIGSNCILMDTDAHSLDHKIRRIPDEDKMAAKSAPIEIEEDVLIGARCIILKGVTIGARSVIGAGSVVTKSIPPDSIAAGNPCRVIAQLKNK